MASEAELIKALKLLTEYYGQEPNETQARLFMRLLEAYPGAVVEEAVLAHISASKWYPKVSELRDRCDGLMPRSESYMVDPLAAEQIDLEHEFYDHGNFDPERYEKLARQYENCDRLARAEQVRRRARLFARDLMLGEDHV